MTTESRQCEYCKEYFCEDEMDLVNGKWLCINCAYEEETGDCGVDC